MVDVIANNVAVASRTVRRDAVQPIESLLDGDVDGEQLDGETLTTLERRTHNRQETREAAVAVEGDGSSAAPEPVRQEELRGGLSGYAKSGQTLEAARVEADSDVGDDTGEMHGRHGGEAPRPPAPAQVAARAGVALAAESDQSGDDAGFDDWTSFGERTTRKETRAAREIRNQDAGDATADASRAAEETGGPADLVAHGKRLHEDRLQQHERSVSPQPDDAALDMPEHGDRIESHAEMVYRFRSWGERHAVRIVLNRHSANSFALVPSTAMVDRQLQRRNAHLRGIHIAPLHIADGEAGVLECDMESGDDGEWGERA
ncbi:hypothetical protein WL21_04695 [Burkholderia ubonensis]|uniref:SpaN/EivJ family type III secretion system needle length determinant n=1 Tax=Burkholderia ubonensis TaxID=101571 RepID=UPI000751FEDB|nr:hypothetical protein [Burkholderia ubonensis]KVO87685.1 hypothetical protein WJ81_15665 [Burkholderia ubonensis]KVZ57302.1 hypothetical protein WL20_23450 [Burkholderia ubonensis]KVZ72999.1 hypothetical protein WL21_04695 [Burkholderia ubonensis]